MKKFLLTAATAAAALTAFSADKFYVIMKDGSVESYPTEKVDSISFNDPQIEKIMGFGDMMQEIAKLKEEIAALKAGMGVQDTSVSDLRYFIINDKEVKVVGFNNGSPDLVVPEKAILSGKEYTVVSIGSEAFAYHEIKSVTLPKTLKKIEDEAFEGCSGLTSVVIPSGVTSIGELAFSDCSGLTSIEIPSGVTSIGELAFSDCSSLTSVVIPSSVTSIGDEAFEGCSGLTSIEIPSSVTSIGNETFEGCSGLTSIEIPSSVTSIGEMAFYGCSGLTSIEIPSSVTSIGSRSFYGCSGLTSVVIPSSVTSIGSSAFNGCSGLSSVVIPSSVTSIGWGAFSECSGLTSVVIPSSVTSIGSSAFQGCYDLNVVCEFSREDMENMEIVKYTFDDCKSVVFKGDWETEKSVYWSNSHTYSGDGMVFTYKVDDEYLVKNESKDLSFSVSFFYEEGERSIDYGVYESVSANYIQVGGRKFEISKKDNSYFIWTESDGFEVVSFGDAKNLSKDVVLVYSPIDYTISSPSVQSTLQQLKTTESLISKDYSKR